jgi:hypothetical protein
MTRGENWKNFFKSMGWINDDVISAGNEGMLIISIRKCEGYDSGKSDTINTALIHQEFDILCHETPSGTVFFQWDDILQVKLEVSKKKKGWL